jgi:hypothetical protein
VNHHVKGILFADYVRMMRAQKKVDWKKHLQPDDLAHLSARIDPSGWYPMETFERLGDAILLEVANNDLQAVRMWGRFSVDALRAANPQLVVDGDPIDTLMRFRVLRASYFDFQALDVLMLIDGQAQVEIRYHMGQPAEEAASYQTMGFFERLLELAGATDVSAHFATRSWKGEARTVLDLYWQLPLSAL